MSIQSEFARLTTVKNNFKIALNYHEVPVSNDELFSDYPSHVASVPMMEIPETVDYNYGYIDLNGWHYENNGGACKNPIDIYKIKKDHYYFVMMGAVVGTRFRVCTVREDIRLKTSGISCMQGLSAENAPKNAYAAMGGYTNPDFNNVKTPFFKAADDGWLCIQKDNNYTTGLKSYVFDLDTPVDPNGGGSGSHTLDESLFDISNGLVTLKSSVDRTTITGRAGVPDTVNGQTVTGIGANCFKDCYNLAAIEFPSGITSIGANAFEGTSLIGLVIPNSVTTVGDYAFKNCTGLRGNANLSSYITSLGVGIFEGCSMVSETNIRAAVTILTDTFKGCVRLQNISMNSTTVTTLDGTFYGCSALRAVPNRSTITTWQNGTFQNCTALTSVSVPDNITGIGVSVFKGCTNITSITIPNSVGGIGSEAFADCEALESVTINNTTPPLLPDVSAFANTNDCPIYVPASAVETYKTNSSLVSHWNLLASRIFAIQE